MQEHYSGTHDGVEVAVSVKSQGQQDGTYDVHVTRYRVGSADGVLDVNEWIGVIDKSSVRALKHAWRCRFTSEQMRGLVPGPLAATGPTLGSVLTKAASVYAQYLAEASVRPAEAKPKPKREFTPDPLARDREWFLTDQGLSAYVRRLTALGKEGWIGVAPGLGGNGSDLMTVAQPTKRDAADAVDDGLRANQVADAPEVETEGLVKVDLLTPGQPTVEWGVMRPNAAVLKRSSRQDAEGSAQWDDDYKVVTRTVYTTPWREA